MFKKNSRLIILAIAGTCFLALFFLVGFGFGYKYLSERQLSAAGQVLNGKEVPQYLENDVNFQEFWQVWDYVKKNYVKANILDSQLFYGAVSGIVESLGDPYSVFLNPEVSKKFSDELSGSFEGIGAEIGLRENQLTIIAPLPGTPADRAGLRAGDLVLTIDGKDTSNMALDYAVSIIRGQKGTKVTLKIYRTGEDQPRELVIARDKIEIDSVRFVKETFDKESNKTVTKEYELMDGNIAYIQLRYFNENTLGDWNKTIQTVLSKNPKGIILDLRNNPGGFLQTAIEIAGEWVNGKNVVLERLRDGTVIEYKANAIARLANIPTLVLVNGGSASGSEIVAGALQDYGLAKLVGETTFGKGSVQDLKEFSDGSSVKLTIAEWLTPKGKNINEAGIEPDVKVELTKDDYDNNRDPQLEKALLLLRGK